MKRMRLIPLSAVCAILVATLFIGPQPISAKKPFQTPSPAIYNPYPSAIPSAVPSGILPDDLNSEIARVQREITGIENEALLVASALPTPVLSSNPPTIEGSGYLAVETLGKLLNYDLNMSPFRNEACAFCHMPYAGFSGPIPSVNLTMIAYPGTFQFRAGKRTAQRYTYSPDFPVLELNPTLAMAGGPTLAAFFGGNFWDGRSTGYKLQSADAEQAQHPPVDTQEHAFPDAACVAFRLSTAVYRPLFETVWGVDFDISWPGNTEQICDPPGVGGSATPIQLSPQDRTNANNIYDHWGQSISKYERSPRRSRFTSKFDAFLKGTYTLTSNEMAGYNLFKGN